MRFVTHGLQELTIFHVLEGFDWGVFDAAEYHGWRNRQTHVCTIIWSGANNIISWCKKFVWFTCSFSPKITYQRFDMETSWKILDGHWWLGCFWFTSWRATNNFFFDYSSSIQKWLVVSNIFDFHPCLGRFQFLTNIFQMGWNHQQKENVQGKTPWEIFWAQLLVAMVSTRIPMVLGKPIRGRTTCPAKFNRCVHLPALKAICNGQAGFFFGGWKFFHYWYMAEKWRFKSEGIKGQVATARKSRSDLVFFSVNPPKFQTFSDFILFETSQKTGDNKV